MTNLARISVSFGRGGRRRSIGRAFSLGAVALLLPCLAAAQPATRATSKWHVTQSDGTATDVEPPFDLASPTFLRAEHGGAAAVAFADLTLHLRDGQRLTGKPATSGGADALAWDSPAFGKRSFPLKLVRGITVGAKPLPPSTGGEDVALLANGDTVKGVVSEMSAESLTLSPSSGDPVKVPWKSLARLSLADLGGKSKPVSTGYQVSLADGTVLRSPDLAFADGDLVIGTAKVHAEQVVSVDRLGPAWSLVLLSPDSVEQHPYLTVARPPVFGHVRAGTAFAGRGIALSPSTKVTWEVPEGATTFRTTCYVTRGQARVTVSAGDQRFEKQLSSGDAPEKIQLSVPSGAGLAVSVDFALPSISADVVLSDPIVSK